MAALTGYSVNIVRGFVQRGHVPRASALRHTVRVTKCRNPYAFFMIPSFSMRDRRVVGGSPRGKGKGEKGGRGKGADLFSMKLV